MAVILASASPRRKELLGFIYSDFTVCASDVKEETEDGLTPEETVRALARLKGEAVFEKHPEDTVISSDTVVVLDGEILGKPHSREEAFSMLRALSGRAHSVYTGVAVFSKEKSFCFAEKTDVTFQSLTEEEITTYVDSGEPFDKAGGYGIQGKGCIMIKSITGDYYNVMGLPVSGLYIRLRENGLL